MTIKLISPTLRFQVYFVTESSFDKVSNKYVGGVYGGTNIKRVVYTYTQENSNGMFKGKVKLTVLRLFVQGTYARPER